MLCSFLTIGLNKANQTKEVAWKNLHQIFPNSPDLHPLNSPHQSMWRARISRKPISYRMACTQLKEKFPKSVVMKKCIEGIEHIFFMSGESFPVLKHNLLTFWGLEGAKNIGDKNYLEKVDSMYR